MGKKRIIVLIGNYGSGKTELAINFAINSAQEGKKTLLVDLDIVNPYFRSAEQRVLLERNGVRVIASAFANTAVDLPVVPAEVLSAFDGEDETVVFDVGGDSVGAMALGQYRQFFARFEDSLESYFVVNVRRPLTSNEDQICRLFEQIQASARMQIKGMINNTNLGPETTAMDILEGQAILAEVSDKLDGPLVYTAGYEKLLEEAEEKQKLLGILMPIHTYMRPDWL